MSSREVVYGLSGVEAEDEERSVGGVERGEIDGMIRPPGRQSRAGVQGITRRYGGTVVVALRALCQRNRNVKAARF